MVFYAQSTIAVISGRSRRRSRGRVLMGLEAGMGYNEKKEQGKGFNGVRGWNGL